MTGPSWATEFGLSDGQKDALIERLGAELESCRDRRNSLGGALKRIVEHRPTDLTLVEFCKAVIDGTALFSIDGRDR